MGTSCKYPVSGAIDTTDWSVMIAEAVNSDAGSAGDGESVALTSTTPDNKHVLLFTNSFDDKLTSQDATNTFARGRSRTIKLGTFAATGGVKRVIIKDMKISEMNALYSQLLDWFKNGNNQAGETGVYLVVKATELSADIYLAGEVNGVTQNWYKIDIKSVSRRIRHNMRELDFTYQTTDN